MWDLSGPPCFGVVLWAVFTATVFGSFFVSAFTTGETVGDVTVETKTGTIGVAVGVVTVDTKTGAAGVAVAVGSGEPTAGATAVSSGAAAVTVWVGTVSVGATVVSVGEETDEFAPSFSSCVMSGFFSFAVCSGPLGFLPFSKSLEMSFLILL